MQVVEMVLRVLRDWRGGINQLQEIHSLLSSRVETQFLTALEDISNRLVIMLKPAWLSALLMVEILQDDFNFGPATEVNYSQNLQAQRTLVQGQSAWP